MNLHQSSVVSLRTKALFIMSVIAALFFIIGIQTAAAQTPGSFSTTWLTTNPGTSSSTAITIPTAGGGYGYTVYWEEVGNAGNNGGTPPLSVTGDITIDFPSAGTYRVDITGTFPRIFFNNAGDREKILTIEQWGTNTWAEMNNAFSGATNLTYEAVDEPDLSAVIDLGSMFSGATSFNGDLDNWDMSNVLELSAMFQGATSFNGTLNGWGTTTASVNSLYNMFNGATSFNQPLDTWDVSSVGNMSFMFFGASAFNRALNAWGTTTASVDNMNAMFRDATNFNQPLDSWDVSSVTIMTDMFAGATNFNGALNGWGTTTASVVDMAGMFLSAANFNQPLDSWDVSSTTNMRFMFSSATNFNSALNGWGATTANLVRTDAMFNLATSFNQPLDAWDLRSLNDMGSMFNTATNFNQPLNNWEFSTTSVVTAALMFRSATSFNQPLDSWDVSTVNNMFSMFESASSFNQPLNAWGTDIAAVLSMSAMFKNASSFNQPLDEWDIRGLLADRLSEAFIGTAWDTANYSATLEGWNAQGNTPDDITITTTAQYLSSAASARQSLIDNNTWIITDGGVAPSRSSGGGGTRVCDPNNPEQKNCRQPMKQTVEIIVPDTVIDQEQLLARIAQLQQLIEELQAQAGTAASSTVPLISTVASANCLFTRDLTIGSSGEDVTCLQTHLISTGDYTYTDGATGYFGQVTKAAVQSWQTRNGVLPAAGYFGSISRSVVTQ